MGCRATGAEAPPVGSSEEELRALEVFDGRTGDPVAWGTLGQRLERAEVVVIGELHGHPVGLPHAALLFHECLAHSPDAALALEFVCRDRQYALDAYLAGLLGWEELEQAMQGSSGSDVGDHRPMIEDARAAGRPVYAANAPRLYTSVARERGYEALEALSAEQQRLFDIPPVMPSGDYRERFFDLMRDDGDEDADASPPTESMLAVLRSQSLWDSTMSATVTRAVGSGCRPVFLVIGQFHSDRDGGAVQLLRHREPGVDVVVVSMVDTWSDTLREEDGGRADFVVYVGPFDDQD